MEIIQIWSTNLFSKFDDTNKFTSNSIIVTVHAYLNEIYKVIKNGTRNEIKWICIHINSAHSDYNGTFYSLKDIKYSYFMGDKGVKSSLLSTRYKWIHNKAVYKFWVQLCPLLFLQKSQRLFDQQLLSSLCFLLIKW